MPVMQLNKNKWRKDGRSWVFYLYEPTIDGKTKQYMSKAYMTREEAENALKEYVEKYKDIPINGHMTFKDAYTKFYEYKEDKVRNTTLKTYKDRIKMVINFAEKNYDFNLRKFYTKMEPFNNSNELEKEMRFYTPEEFYKFISVIEELDIKCLFKVLYYCGLRRSETRGLTWDCIDLVNKKLYVKKQIIANEKDSKVPWRFAPLKTKKSYRTLPLADTLVNDLQELYDQMKKYKNFKNSWFVFGDENPISIYKMNYQNEKNAKLAEVKVINLHGFRHSCDSMLINDNVNIAVVSHYLGHADIEETLDTYTHMFDKKLNEVPNYIDTLANNLAKSFTQINF